MNVIKCNIFQRFNISRHRYETSFSVWFWHAFASPDLLSVIPKTHYKIFSGTFILHRKANISLIRTLIYICDMKTWKSFFWKIQFWEMKSCFEIYFRLKLFVKINLLQHKILKSEEKILEHVLQAWNSLWSFHAMWTDSFHGSRGVMWDWKIRKGKSNTIGKKRCPGF